jgi:hypothetical protein
MEPARQCSPECHQIGHTTVGLARFEILGLVTL